jgi:hypothetical protein
MGDAQSEEIDDLLNELYCTQVGSTTYGPSARVQQQVPMALVSIANRSPEARDKVIRGLIELLEENANGGEDIAFYTACELVGKLRAVEAIDTLVKYVDYQPDRIGASLNYKPAVKGLIQIGEDAIPKVAEAFMSRKSHLHRNNHLLRVNAMTALKHIGGTQAKKALETVCSVEQDARFKEWLQQAIQDVERGGRTKGNVVIRGLKTEER